MLVCAQEVKYSSNSCKHLKNHQNMMHDRVVVLNDHSHKTTILWPLFKTITQNQQNHD